MKFIFCFLASCAIAFGTSHTPFPPRATNEEGLLIRRLLHFWRDKEYPCIQSEIQSYFGEKGEEAPLADYFWAMLGDLALQSQAFEEALIYYGKIQSSELKTGTQAKKWHALYYLKNFHQLYQEGGALSADTLGDEENFYVAEASFREALDLINKGEQEAGMVICHKALSHHERVVNHPTLNLYAQLTLATIYHLFHSPEKTLSLLNEVIAAKPEPPLMLQAASLLIPYDSALAATLFKHLAGTPSSISSEAAYQWFLLLIAAKDWKTILHERSLFTRLSEERLPLVYFYLGEAACETNEPRLAFTDFQKCLEKKLPPSYEAQALLRLHKSADSLKQWEICTSCFKRLDTQFKELRPQAYFMQAGSYQQGARMDEALLLYEKIVTQFASSPFAPSAHLKKIGILTRQKKFQEAHQSLMAFFKTYPHSEKKVELMRFAIELSLAQIAEQGVYEQLAAHLKEGLNENLFYKEEKIEKQHLLVTAYLKLNQPAAAFEILKTLDAPDPLLLTYCHIKMESSPEEVIHYGEKALALHPQEQELHLHLFNAYVALAKKEPKEKLARKAADHLYAIHQSLPLSLENQLWLSRYLAQEDPLKAIDVLENLLDKEEILKRFGEEALFLATLYRQQPALWEKGEVLLKRIAALHLENQEEAELRLGEILQLRGRNEEARTLYQTLENRSTTATVYTARLNRAKLDYPNDPEKNIKKLQTLMQRKNLLYEPIHLEAALEYAELQATAGAEPLLLARLMEIRDEFSRQEDFSSKEYHAQRARNPEKDLIYQAYMRYIDARIYALQAYLSTDPLEKKTKFNAAKALFSTLRHGKYAVTFYLKERATARYESLD